MDRGVTLKNNDNAINDIKNFITGLKKSFSFRQDFTRELNSCNMLKKIQFQI